jgi:outer membrane biosynthesis protein TonB
MILAHSRRRGRIRVALLLSVGGHLVAAAVLALFMNAPSQKPAMKQGDSLVVELSAVEEPKPGTPAGREAEAIPPSPPSAPARRAPAPTPPRPPAAKPPPVERPVAPPRVASAPPPPSPAPAPPASLPTPTLPPDTTVSTSPAPPPDAVAKAPEAGPGQPAAPAPSPPTPAPPRIAAGPRDGGGAGAASRVAPDLRSLRGSGGVGSGRGGIDGAPIALNSDDPNLADYLQRVKRAIERHWAWPCMKPAGSNECRYQSAELQVEFGILKSGKLQFVELRVTSGLVAYDDSAVTAIKLASPFPAVPPALMAKANRGSSGVPIMANFVYEYEVTIRSLLR